LYLDIKNAFNAMNHRALFRIMELWLPSCRHCSVPTYV
jgi:hypothetical protein